VIVVVEVRCLPPWLLWFGCREFLSDCNKGSLYYLY